jgi:nucleoside-specific outer membrane channel protein Tsx
MTHMLFANVKPIRHVHTVHAMLTAWTALLCVCNINSAHAGAATFSSTNIQYLVGSNYELGDKTRSIITLEHVNAWKYGDNFFFADIDNPTRTGANTQTGFYGEISPRFSLSALTGQKMSFGIVKDVLITTTLEAGNGFHNNLYGVAVDLDILPVFQINYYLRNEIGAGTDLGSQLTLVWLAPFNAGTASMVFEGFFDYAWGLKPSEDNIVTGPRLLVDVGKLWGAPGTLQAGVEYQMWRNKYGIDGVDENVPQAMVKWIW